MREVDYRAWISEVEPSEEGLAVMERHIDALEYLPHVSLIMVVSDVDEVWIKKTVGSTIAQIYPHLELCVCDNGSVRAHVSEVLEDYAATENRVKSFRLPERESLAAAYNEAFSRVTGDLVALVDAGDELAPEAILRVVEFLQAVGADIVYTDEDHLDVSNRRSDPVFKPYWSPDLLLSGPYIGRLCVMRRSLLKASGFFREGFDGAEEHDLLLRCSERASAIRHLPEVLYHRRTFPDVLGVSERTDAASVRAVEEALARRGQEVTVEREPIENFLRVIRPVPEDPDVSVILSVPEAADGEALVRELRNRTSCPIRRVITTSSGREVVVSAAHVVHPFPARALNLAVEETDSEYLVFIDGRVRSSDSEWLSMLLAEAQRPEVGVVGGRITGPGGVLRHGGSLVDVGRLVGVQEDPAPEAGASALITDRVFNFAAGSAECMVVRRAVFEAIGGFDYDKLPTAFYDLDLSFRLREEGLLNVYVPYVLLTGARTMLAPSEGEIAYMWRKWWDELVRVLYYRWVPVYTARYGVERDTLTLLAT